MQVQTYNYVETRVRDLAILLAKVKQYNLPPTWNMNVADSSITLTSPCRRQVVKVDIYREVFIDRIKRTHNDISVKSEKHRCENIDATWALTEKTLNTFLKR